MGSPLMPPPKKSRWILIARHNQQTELQSGLTDAGDHDAMHEPAAKLHCSIGDVGDNGFTQTVKVRPLL